jgi:hypothetical protein
VLDIATGSEQGDGSGQETREGEGKASDVADVVLATLHIPLHLPGPIKECQKPCFDTYSCLSHLIIAVIDVQKAVFDINGSPNMRGKRSI